MIKGFQDVYAGFGGTSLDPHKRKPYQIHTKEFKQEAVRLMETSNRPTNDIAMELGIRRNQLYKWKEELSEKAMLRSKAAAARRKKTRTS